VPVFTISEVEAILEIFNVGFEVLNDLGNVCGTLVFVKLGVLLRKMKKDQDANSFVPNTVTDAPVNSSTKFVC
jgi:hypothetical protein